VAQRRVEDDPEAKGMRRSMRKPMPRLEWTSSSRTGWVCGFAIENLDVLLSFY